MKKKILALCLVAVLALTAIGGTLAYFTDTDEVDNALVIGSGTGPEDGGKVDIEIEEIFPEDNLMPGIPVNKDVWIKVQEKTEDSYVWYEYLVPAALDGILHVVSLEETDDRYCTEEVHEKCWDHDGDPSINVPETGFVGTWNDDNGTPDFADDDILYNRYVVLYHGIVAPGESTTQCMDYVELDKGVNYVNPTEGDNGEIISEGYYTFKGEKINYDFSKGVSVIVRAASIQAAGFANVYEAYNAYYVQHPATNG